ncbi:MAG: hypothetical protein IGR93_01035 [Hydrococcus sp. C42_A2020_068]|uniref:hypothetical protein n=1 Tax=Pleurocapsa sp. PCC 7327 TaxID=118163 RepID=UPI00029FD2A8|nr:hypothetical protein [Pleurocapsa sp. PCC 7327]AFY76482.1 hypothetical protein Ple7327_1068 [Pleurocapsa sp. PCC 7327]MBF2018718.1 hypothetical protein [Hydrococcus sp. C42_A2020_068]
MNLKTLLLAISYTTVLAAAPPVNIQSFSLANTAQIQQQMQQTTITLAAEQLRHPHFLRVSTSTTGTQLTGQIKLNGKVIQRLNNNTKINLSRLLTRGKHAIEISGRYRPAGNSVQVELIGPNTQSLQQIGGSGYLNQRLIIEVK